MEADTLILGAGAAGLYCAGLVPGAVVLDHAGRPAEKVRISGGGRCNFTNLRTGPGCFISGNPHFAKSALASHTAHDFLALVERHRIPWHEKAAGQLFCDRSSRDIIAMLLAEAERAGSEVRLGAALGEVGHDGSRFTVEAGAETWRARRLVVATGGRSIPKMGATGFAYRVAERFGLAVTDTRPALVPFTFGDRFAGLAGVAVPVAARAAARADGPAFEDAMLFTHRGLSGPAMLQASSYWREGEEVAVALRPGLDWGAELRAAKRATPRRTLRAALAERLPQRLAEHLADGADGHDGPLGGVADARLDAVARGLGEWRLRPAGTEGYRTAEVTLGGVDTAGLSGRTMEARGVPGLFFIGECVDVTGWLGGHNFQWAWSSAAAAARAIRGA